MQNYDELRSIMMIGFLTFQQKKPEKELYSQLVEIVYLKQLIEI